MRQRKYSPILIFYMLTLVLIVGCKQGNHEKENFRRPNVILIMTDDQGYGDLSCHGNTIIKTPNIDRLYNEAIRFTDFHVSPFCTPTRSALMTGRYPARNGAYRTSSGRTMMHVHEKTVANVFASNGYKTGMVGKWHLGDNAPHRPQDRGFQYTVWHKCGGVGQASDYWGNDYFDDVYEKNGELQQFEGYCTDVWFEEAIKFIETDKDGPFFLYLATNAPHGPYIVSEEWSTPYEERVDWRKGPEFYGMIANLDYNLGIFREKLDKLGIADNTILIFMTDNGTANGGKFDGLHSEAITGYNAGMRGKKSSMFEGGHRVPFFIYWPDGAMKGGRDIESLTAHIDVLPTLVDLCGLSTSDSLELDGISFKPQIEGALNDNARNHLVAQLHGGAYFKNKPKKWQESCVLTDKWRLINGKELYDIQKDPSQREDVSGDNPNKVKELRSVYNAYWKSVSPGMKPVLIDLGNPAENPTTLCSQDWYLPYGNPPWNFRTISKLPKETGPWKVNIKTPGKYRITLRQFPKEADNIVEAVRAKIQISGIVQEKFVEPGSKGVVFEIELPTGPSELVTYLYNDEGVAGGAYFTEVEALSL
ncbi:arylsulfatase [Maribellus maritimus]|uniref:arylsulfatase n=1 Tax=Maribellus maritimus TaxID=2870838 RepID=UPI001EEC0A66|nr:arylsulfatase [Maribellus maritimus]MCG6191240.1 arylsulfatase [Maribellus maritimus]